MREGDIEVHEEDGNKRIKAGKNKIWLILYQGF